ncbi:hypothetical protein AKJ62_02380 [candidate division MSBL1 archaeon SCGC-AAA259D14]|uniref:Transcription regulator AsnC/Lrp ligand binding domain-containing protein n=2 Tax=candidate division MSBL1 TaxID=215777 RepID=A0A133U6H9_9EURY|nr:hypothetical protein AKJ62_02380 [candidate division MSBL1 archaeon SCGC-AAA259D14]KXA94326.1 hypothetical protein AKJ36_03065 [candidate division MSBL1 archaeon SCGC-AAA259I07]
MVIFAGALFLINTRSNATKDVFDSIGNQKGIQKTEMLTGPHDIMALAKTKDMREIKHKLIREIRSIKGVKKTITCLFIEYGSCEATTPPTG